MREYGLAGNMHFRFLHLIKQVLKSTRHTTGGRCSVSAQASGADSAVLSQAGRRDASPTPSRGCAAGNAVVPDGPLPSITGVPLVIDSSRRSAASVLDARLSPLDSSPSSATRHSRFAAFTCPTLSTILHPHEHGQNSFDSRSSSDRAAQGSRHCGVSGVGRQGMPDSGLGTRASFISKSCYEGNLQRLLVIAERIQGQNHPVDVYSLDRTVHLRFRRHQVSLIPVAAVCDRRRPQGRDAAPSGSHSRGSAAGSAVVPDGPLPSITGVPLVIDSSRGSAASLLDARLSSLDSSPSSVTRHSRFAASDLLSFRRSAATRHQLLVTRHSRPAASYH